MDHAKPNNNYTKINFSLIRHRSSENSDPWYQLEAQFVEDFSGAVY